MWPWCSQEFSLLWSNLFWHVMTTSLDIFRTSDKFESSRQPADRPTGLVLPEAVGKKSLSPPGDAPGVPSGSRCNDVFSGWDLHGFGGGFEKLQPTSTRWHRRAREARRTADESTHQEVFATVDGRANWSSRAERHLVATKGGVSLTSSTALHDTTGAPQHVLAVHLKPSVSRLTEDTHCSQLHPSSTCPATLPEIASFALFVHVRTRLQLEDLARHFLKTWLPLCSSDMMKVDSSLMLKELNNGDLYLKKLELDMNPIFDCWISSGLGPKLAKAGEVWSCQCGGFNLILLHIFSCVIVPKLRMTSLLSRDVFQTSCFVMAMKQSSNLMSTRTLLGVKTLADIKVEVPWPWLTWLTSVAPSCHRRRRTKWLSSWPICWSAVATNGRAQLFAQTAEPRTRK